MWALGGPRIEQVNPYDRLAPLTKQSLTATCTAEWSYLHLENHGLTHLQTLSPFVSDRMKSATNLSQYFLASSTFASD